MVSERANQLFLLNVSLQLFDGVATYHGLQWHWAEGNPLIVSWMPALGVGLTLMLFKAKACGFLVVLRRLAERPWICESMLGLAGVYLCLSFLPWLSRIVSLLYT